MKNNKLMEVVDFLRANPSYLKRGCANIAYKLGCKIEEVKEAKKIIGVNTNSKEEYSEYVVEVKNSNKDKKKLKKLIKLTEKINPLYNPIEDLIKNYKLSTEDIPEVIQKSKILVLDIETAPISAYCWALWKQDIYIDQIVSDWFMLSWAAKWLGEDEVLSARLYAEEVKDECDFRIVKELWNLLDEADIVIAHNGDQFDIPKIKTRFVINGLPPTSFYQQIDTLKIARKEFGFSSNKLDFLARSFNIPPKISTDFKLWVRCLKGEDAALEEMETYNKHDVEILEEVYYKLRPYIKNHPNVSLYLEDSTDRCPTCGGKHLTPNKFYFTSVGKFQVYKCEDCEALSRSRKCIKRTTTTSNLSLGR